MNVVQGYGSDSDDEPVSVQAVASGSKQQLDDKVDANEDEEEEGGVLDSNDVFGLNGLTKNTAKAEAESSAIVRTAPDVSTDVSKLD